MRKHITLAVALGLMTLPASADYIYRIPLLSIHSGETNSGGSFTPPPEVEAQEGSQPGTCDLTKQELDVLTNTDLAFSKFPGETWGWDCKNGVYASQTRPALFYRDANITTGFKRMVNRNEGGYAERPVMSPNGQPRIMIFRNGSASSCAGSGGQCGSSRSGMEVGMIGRLDPDSMVPLEMGSTIDVDDPLIVSMSPAGFSLHKPPMDTLVWPAGLNVGEEAPLGGTFTVQQDYITRAFTAERSFNGGATFEPAAGQVRAAGDEFFYTPAPSDLGAQIRLAFTVMERYGKVFTDLKSDLSGPIGEPFQIQDKAMYVGIPYSYSGTPIFPLVRGGSGDNVVTVTNMPSIPGISEVDGFLVGTPTVTGSWSVGLSAVDQVTNEAITGTLDLTIENDEPLLFAEVSRNGPIPLNYSAVNPLVVAYQVGLTGGIGEIDWSISGSLPNGVNFNPNTGIFSGSIPSSLLAGNLNGASYSVSVTAEDEVGVRKSTAVGFVILNEFRGVVDRDAFRNSRQQFPL